MSNLTQASLRPESGTLVEVTDVIFAVDSIPAILAVTRSEFIVFTSNAFAILGLRALYFLLKGLLDKLVYLSTGLAVILVFIGVKLVLEALHATTGLDVPEIPIWFSLLFIVVVLTITALASVYSTRDRRGSGVDDQEG